MALYKGLGNAYEDSDIEQRVSHMWSIMSKWYMNKICEVTALWLKSLTGRPRPMVPGT